MGAGMFFCRHPDAVRSAFAVSTSYMPVKSNDDIDDPYVTTAQWSRRMIGLKMFMSLAELGADGYARQIENQAALGNLIRERLRATDWRIDNDTLLPVVCFSDDRLSIADDWAMKMLTIVYRRNRVWISQVKLGKKQVLRACVTSYHTNAEDIECLIDELEVARRQA